MATKPAPRRIAAAPACIQQPFNVAAVCNVLANNAVVSSAVVSSAAVSSVAAENPGTYGLGYAEAAALGDTTFDGVTLGSNAVLVKYTLVGDANLDGTVNFSDYSILQNNYGLSSNWSSGDFNYDGMTNFNDFSSLQNNFGQSLSAVLT